MPKPMRTSSTRFQGFDKLLTSPFNETFFNRAFDKSRIKGLVKWTLSDFGEYKTLALVENLKDVGFFAATQAGLSLGIDDLLIPPAKISHIVKTEAQLEQTQVHVSKGYLTSVEYLSQVITTWNETNDVVKNEVISHFRSKDILNPVYMMAFSGARGNISQVRQLVGMRGLMSDPSGRIIDYAIQSNFREGLTLTEYVISCYGSRKGVVDTALRTATSGYLTRRLVDVAQHVVIREKDCKTKKGVYLTSLENEDKVYMTGPFRLTGRVLAEDVYDRLNSKLLAKRNQEATPDLASLLFQHHTKILIRSPLTCQSKRFICQLCYGWNLAKGRLVSVGETVGVIAGQSIGEPGTQLTMRTFHTGGVFSGEISKTFKSPVYGKIFFLNSIPGKCVRTNQGEVAFLTKQSGTIYLQHLKETHKQKITKIFLKPYYLLFVKQGQIVYPDQILAEPSSLEKLSDKQPSFQTIFSPVSGEVKFRTADIAKGAHNAGYTTFAPLNQSPNEFWILTAHVQRFKKFMAPFVKPGDQVDFRSPVFFYNLVAKTYTPPVFGSFVFHQYLSFYRLQTLFQVVQPPTKDFFSKKKKFFPASNLTTPTAVWFSPPLMERGTVLERVLPFVSFVPKDRLSFAWINNLVKSDQRKQKKPFFKSPLQIVSTKKTSLLSQTISPFKTKNTNPDKNKNTCHFKRLMTFCSQPWQPQVSENYPLTINQKSPIQFFVSLCPFLAQTVFSAWFKLTRNTETKQFNTVLASWLTLFEKNLFLSIKFFFTGCKKGVSLKQLDIFEPRTLTQLEHKKLFYCPNDNLWLLNSLNPPTDDFKQPVSNIFSQTLTRNLSYELNNEPQNDQILKKNSIFCLYYRLAMHYRFQTSYDTLFFKTFRPFQPALYTQFHYGIQHRIKQSKRLFSIPYFPKSSFAGRIHQHIQFKAFFLVLKQRQEEFQPLFEPIDDCDQQKNDEQEKGEQKKGEQKKGEQKKREQKNGNNLIQNFDKIFTFHEFIQLPFCFETFSTKSSQLIPKCMVEKQTQDKKKNHQNIVSGFAFLSSIMHQFQIQLLLKEKVIKQTTRQNKFFQKDILIYVLIHTAKISWDISKKFINSLLLLTVAFSKTFLWKHVLQKQNQLLNNTLLNFSTLSSTKKNQIANHKKADPNLSMYYFLKKEFSKKATTRVQPMQSEKAFIDSLVSKRAWFSNTKRQQIAKARLNIVYRLAFLVTPDCSNAFQLFTSPLFQTNQQRNFESFEPLFDFYFGLFETRYYKGWNFVTSNQKQRQSAHQVYLKKWFHSLFVLREQKRNLLQTKRKLNNHGKSTQSKIRSLMLLWFSDGEKTRYNAPINKKTIPFSAYQIIDLASQKMDFPHAQLFLQKNYENHFLTKFKAFRPKLKNLSMLFLLTGFPGFLNSLPFGENVAAFKWTQPGLVSVQNTTLLYRETHLNQLLLSLLKQVKKYWLQKQLNTKNKSKPKNVLPVLIPTKQKKETKNSTAAKPKKQIKGKSKKTNKKTKAKTKQNPAKPKKTTKTRKLTKGTGKTTNQTKQKKTSKSNKGTAKTTNQKTSKQIKGTAKTTNKKTSKKIQAASKKTSKKIQATSKKTNRKTKALARKIKIKLRKPINQKLKLLKTKLSVQKVHKLKPGQNTPINLLPTSRLSIIFQQQSQFNKNRDLNPFGWISFVNCSSKYNRNLGSNQMKLLKTNPTRQTCLAFFQKQLSAVYDPWWRHQMHQTYISASIPFLQKQTPLKMTVAIKHFLKHPNSFFASYLEKHFFNNIRGHQATTSLWKQIFIDELGFYTQAIELKVKKETQFVSGLSWGLNVKTVNNYVRFAFLKTARLPLIGTAKTWFGRRQTEVQKRSVLFQQEHILISKMGRYRPALVFGAVKYKKSPKQFMKKSTKTKIELVTKSPYVLSMLQKGIVYRTGDAMAKTFGQTDFRSLNSVSLSGINPIIKRLSNNEPHRIPAFNLSTFFHTSQLTSFQTAVFQSHFKPSSRWLLLYQPLFKATHIYISQQFNRAGSTFAYESNHIQMKCFDRLNGFAQLKNLSQIENHGIHEKGQNNEPFKKMLVTSPVDGLVVHCYDGEAKSKDASIYEYDMRRFRDQPQKECHIAYVTNRDMTTYLFSLPLQKLGECLSHGTKIRNHLLNESGQVIAITKTKFILRKAQCFYLAAGSDCNLNGGDFVSFGTPLVNVAYSQIKADDIIQGIPKIDQLFEARTRFGSLNLKQVLKKQYHFLRNKGSHTKQEAMFEAIDFIQRKIVDGVQTVYQSQGVTISDKHIEVIVKQMTTMVRVTTPLNSGYLKGDVVPLNDIVTANLLEAELFECEPVLFGITQTALQAEGFLSAASFQETVRILTQATANRTVDFLTHLKENIIIGHVLPTGHGLVDEDGDMLPMIEPT